jgi:hypothetical protein
MIQSERTHNRHALENGGYIPAQRPDAIRLLPFSGSAHRARRSDPGLGNASSNTSPKAAFHKPP